MWDGEAQQKGITASFLYVVCVSATGKKIGCETEAERKMSEYNQIGKKNPF